AQVLPSRPINQIFTSLIAFPSGACVRGLGGSSGPGPPRLALGPASERRPPCSGTNYETKMT
ncbi:MAG: hypothetical protein ACK55Z_23000, partial [bacterium]